MRGREEYYKETGGNKNMLAAVLIAMAVSVVVTGLLLLLLTVVLYNTEISGTLSGIIIVAIYVLGPFAGAFVLGKMVKKKRFLWGLLLGIIYFVVFVVLSLMTAEEGCAPGIRDYAEVMLAVLPGGILGGMFS